MSYNREDLGSLTTIFVQGKSWAGFIQPSTVDTRDFSFHSTTLPGTPGPPPPWGLKSALRYCMLGWSHGLSPTTTTQPSSGAQSVIIPAKESARSLHWTPKDKVTSVAPGHGWCTGSCEWIMGGLWKLFLLMPLESLQMGHSFSQTPAVFLSPLVLPNSWSSFCRAGEEFCSHSWYFCQMFCPLCGSFSFP